ncbi:hypothetical protein NDU88_006556 [Pleurodeles waltl]|uniref:Uncharacterized protein n=1 Tax=Pleurodeles waltl TaxID=8319 RepID=A0AAV7PLS3_PLEWA|nr:hypothetical protein NDU88_006556 [Pleurodeles waltl]
MPRTGPSRNTSISKPLKNTAKHTSASGNRPDKPDEHAGARRIEAAEKTVRVLADYEVSKWRPPPGLGSVSPGLEGEKLGARLERERPALTPRPSQRRRRHPLASAECEEEARSCGRNQEVMRRRTPARRGSPRTGTRSVGKN